MRLSCTTLAPSGIPGFGASHAKGPSSGFSRLPGFLGQAGGFDTQGRLRLVALWQGAEALASCSKVVGQWSSVQENRAVKVRMAIPGAAPTTDQALAQAKILRIVQGKVNPGSQEELLELQLTFWRPSLSARKDLLGGWVGICEQPPYHYLAVTLWRSEAAHDRWVEEHVPRLRQQTQARRAFAEIRTHKIFLASQWRCLAAEREAACR